MKKSKAGTTANKKYSSTSTTRPLNWADMGAVGWLVDGAAIVNRGWFMQRTSYGLLPCHGASL